MIQRNFRKLPSNKLALLTYTSYRYLEDAKSCLSTFMNSLQMSRIALRLFIFGRTFSMLSITSSALGISRLL